MAFDSPSSNVCNMAIYKMHQLRPALFYIILTCILLHSKGSLKVRLRWFEAVLQGSGKFIPFLLSIDALRRTIYHWIAKEEGYIMIEYIYKYE